MDTLIGYLNAFPSEMGGLLGKEYVRSGGVVASVRVRRMGGVGVKFLLLWCVRTN